jgi:hypothetical protein
VNRKEYDALLDLIDQRIDASFPIRAEYFRGYRLPSGYSGVLFRFQKAEEVPPEQFASLPVVHRSFFGFHSRAIRCASAISSGTILSAISFIFIATSFRSAISAAG